ncbi:hypothetical protein RC30_08745 [Campylobacter jejuni]|nr:hypothetical protein RC30_08745 [Campylobacter jejuni]
MGGTRSNEEVHQCHQDHEGAEEQQRRQVGLLQQLRALNGGPGTQVGGREPGEELRYGEEQHHHRKQGLQAARHELRNVAGLRDGLDAQAVDQAEDQEGCADRHGHCGDQRAGHHFAAFAL